MKLHRLLWIWMFAIPTIIAFNLAMNDLGGWLSQMQQWTESTNPELAPQNRYLRDGVAWMHVGLSWLSFGVIGITIIESIIFSDKRLVRKVKLHNIRIEICLPFRKFQDPTQWKSSTKATAHTLSGEKLTSIMVMY